MRLLRNKHIQEVSGSDINNKVVLQGFVSNIRDLGSIIFITLREKEKAIQIVFDENTKKEVYDLAKKIRNEYVVGISGIIREKEKSKNTEKSLISDLEVVADDLEIYSKADTPPIYILDNDDVNEDLRLKYRYLDLRKPSMQEKFFLRSKFLKITRDFFVDEGFIELDTPILVKPTPEGARDYIVPSRVNKGSFYALPQSPQLYKQLFMVSGFDRYFQIAKCFRDEDLRADRQPEFTQIDLEMSFINEDMIIDVQEKYLKKVFKEMLNLDIKTPFKRLSYEESMSRYGTDRPDLRFGLELKDISEIVKNSEFKIFSEAGSGNKIVAGINFSSLNEKISRKKYDKLTNDIKTFNAKGLLYLRVGEEVTSSFDKFVKKEEMDNIFKAFDAKNGDIILIVSGEKKVVYDSLSYLRLTLAKENNLYDENEFNFVWVLDFPLFEKDEETGKIKAIHHPFTAPKISSIEELENSDPLTLLSRAYDIVLNGIEIGGGSIRINDINMQSIVFNILGLAEEEKNEKFGFLLESFKYGVPPHGGLAYGLDRLLMLILKEESIREIIAFPKNQNAVCPLTKAPSNVDTNDLNELDLQIKKN